MGYTTQFAGVIDLSGPVPLKVAKKWLDLCENDDRKSYPRGAPDSYLQWVPTEDLKGIVWNQGEKFYEYVAWLRWVIEHFVKPNKLVANGRLIWSGEEVGDSGEIVVSENTVTATEYARGSPKRRAPMTTRKLADLILERLAE